MGKMYSDDGEIFDNLFLLVYFTKSIEDYHYGCYKFLKNILKVSNFITNSKEWIMWRKKDCNFYYNNINVLYLEFRNK
jgi:hypothetical protein